jgi:hypothetical protein
MDSGSYVATIFFPDIFKNTVRIAASYQASNDRLIVDTSTSEDDPDSFYMTDILEIQINNE